MPQTSKANETIEQKSQQATKKTTHPPDSQPTQIDQTNRATGAIHLAILPEAMLLIEKPRISNRLFGAFRGYSETRGFPERCLNPAVVTNSPGSRGSSGGGAQQLPHNRGRVNESSPGTRAYSRGCKSGSLLCLFGGSTDNANVRGQATAYHLPTLQGPTGGNAQPGLCQVNGRLFGTWRSLLQQVYVPSLSAKQAFKQLAWDQVDKHQGMGNGHLRTVLRIQNKCAQQLDDTSIPFQLTRGAPDEVQACPVTQRGKNAKNQTRSVSKG